MAFRVSKGQRKGTLLTLTWIALLVLGIAAAGGVVIYKLVFGKSDVFDPSTLCPAAGSHGHVVLLVDRSDPLTFTQRKDFEVLFRDVLISSVPKGHLLSVYALADDFKATAEPLMEMCNPGDGRDARELDGNPAMLRKAFDEKYLKPLLARRDELITDMPGKASPILEMIQLAGITGFNRRAVPEARRLIVVSDFIQNTPELPMYKVGIPEYESFRSTAYGKKVLADLKDVKVELRMLLNRPDLQTEKLLKFWQEHIRASGGRVVLYEPVKG
ncbi:hypothetical protein [Ramlibacter sp.]|uniref:hypothetical protein n=1 Tax=Ramlibacter sp. TaxID=1917967 RepID=UPI002D757A02|nr:hypothetical protein [Ramlibacter sp.]HYD77542.1 hypothetical protein [Ramlibacter sp.]